MMTQFSKDVTQGQSSKFINPVRRFTGRQSFPGKPMLMIITEVFANSSVMKIAGYELSDKCGSQLPYCVNLVLVDQF